MDHLGQLCIRGGWIITQGSMHDVMRRGRGGSRHSDVTDAPLEGPYAIYVYASVCILLSLALTPTCVM